MALVIVTTVTVMERIKGPTGPSPERSVATEKASPAPMSVTERQSGDAAPTQLGAAVVGSSEVNESTDLDLASLPVSEVDRGRRRIEPSASERLTSPSPQIILRVRDELTQQERLVTIPSVVIGARPMLASTKPTQNEMENVY